MCSNLVSMLLKVLIGALGLSVALNGLLLYSSLQPALQATASPTSCSVAGVDFLGYSDMLDGQSYEGFEIGGLSGITYDPREGLYYILADDGLKDASAHFYTLSIPLDSRRLTDPAITAVTVLHDQQGEPFTGANFDGEGIQITPEGELLIVSEKEPSIRRFSTAGQFLAELAVPQKFLVAPEGGAQKNGSFESLSLSPDGRSLFTMNQEPLASDGQEDVLKRKRLRLLRYEDRGSSEFEPAQEFFYLAEHNNSVSDVLALSERELLVLESGERHIYRVSLDGAEDVSDEESLADSSASPLEKELLVDVDDDCPLPSGNALDRFGLLEDLSRGPELPGGRRALLLQSDDDYESTTKTRLIALSVQL